MSVVNITNIKVLNNPTLFTADYQFEITFECISELNDDLEWKIIYVGSSESKEYDQVLDSIMVGPVPPGVNQFIFQAPAPNPDRIPPSDLLDVTVIIITCSYRDQEFVRVGYYVNNEYIEEELRENPPDKVIFDKLYRNILADKPRVTRMPIKWDSEDETVKLNQESDDVMGGIQEQHFSNRSHPGDSQGQIEQIGFMPPLQNSGQPSSANYDPMSSVKIESMSS
ncbi:ASF1 like histone chaperone-domain-containing protein [Rhizophagus diaphanus]|nr:ASF1 like histone chaperone-domain-containing protein [Rhizophagus diaphanus] [Rhizophagus sp. MUCL 43196]